MYQESSLKAGELNNLGCGFALDQKHAKALRCFLQAIQIKPDFSDAHHNLGILYTQGQKYTQAKLHLEKAMQLHPGNYRIFNSLGNLYFYQQKIDASVCAYKKAILLNPNSIESLVNLGKVYLEIADLASSKECFELATSLDRNNLEAHIKLAIVLYFMNDFTQAMQVLLTIIKIHPKNWEANYYLARIYDYQNLPKQALVHYTESLTSNPEHSEGWMLLAKLYENLADFSNALKYYSKSIAINPHNLCALSCKLFLQLKLCNWDKLEITTNILVNTANKLWENGNNSLIDPFQVQALPCSYTFKQQISADKANFILKEVIDVNTSQSPNSAMHIIQKINRKIRVGYLSPDFCQHSVGVLIRDNFSLHDKSKFHITCYNLYPNPQDAITKDIIAASDEFIDLYKYNYNKADKIRDDQIDILVDLAGYTKHACPDILSLQVAPIQCQWLGFSASMQMPYIQYFIGHKQLVPDNIAKFFSEKIVHLPHTYCATKHFDSVLPVVNRKLFGLPEQGFIFCCFSSSYRIEPIVFACWMRILKACANSYLWLYKSNEQVKHNLCKQAATAGIDPHRLIFLDSNKITESWAHQLADMWLDTLQISSTTGVFFALWANLPLLTMSGDTADSRQASTLLTASGLSELVVNSKDAYIQQAIYYYQHPEQLNNLKLKIKTHKHTYAIFNPALLIKDLEQAYLKMLEN